MCVGFNILRMCYIILHNLRNFQRVIVLKEINMQVNTYTPNNYTYGKGLNVLILMLLKKKSSEGEKDQGLCAVS